MTVRPVANNRQGLCIWLTRLWRGGFVVLLTSVCVISASGTARGQEPAWKTGTALRKQLETPLSLVWGDREVRDALASLAKNTLVAIHLDRRIDPSLPLEMNVSDEPLKTVLGQVAQRVEGGVSMVGSVIYIGPKPTADKLATLAMVKQREVGGLSPQHRAKVLKSEAWSWDELAPPRELLTALAARGGVTVTNPELIPHDLWPAANWPAMTWTDRLTLLLAGFDLTFEPAGEQTIRLVPIPEVVLVEKTYTPRGDVERAAADLARLVPAATITVKGKTLSVSAAAEQHERIDRLLRGERVTTSKVTPGQKRYTLTIENQPAGAVIKTIAEQLGKEMKYDPTLVESLQSKVSFTVQEVPLDELLAKTLNPLGLTHRLDEQTLEIISK